MQRLSEGDVTTIGQRSDDQTRLIAQILVSITKLGVANVGETILFLVVPPMSQLALPHEIVHALTFGRDQFRHHVSGVHIDLNRVVDVTTKVRQENTYGTDGHDLLSKSGVQIAEQMDDQRVQLGDLFAIEIFQGVLVAFFQLGEGSTHFHRPPDLRASQRDLSGILDDPLVTRLLFVGADGLGQMVSHRFALLLQQSKPREE